MSSHRWYRVEIRIRPAQDSDIAALKDRLREADAQEVIAEGNESTEHALRQSISRSIVSYCVDIDGVPSAVWGIVPDSLLGDSANVWFLGAPEMSKIKKTFMRVSRQVIAEFLISFPVLWNHVDARYTKTFRWLKSCGAQFSQTPIRLGGVDFYPFVIRRA